MVNCLAGTNCLIKSSKKWPHLEVKSSLYLLCYSRVQIFVRKLKVYVQPTKFKSGIEFYFCSSAVMINRIIS